MAKGKLHFPLLKPVKSERGEMTYLRGISMESSEHNSVFIYPSICTKRLNFSELTFLILLFLDTV